MEARDILKLAMKTQKKTQRFLAERFNKSPQCISSSFHTRGMSADTFMKYMEAVGYRTQFVDKDGNILETEVP